jgi:hypothetical protein
MTVGRLRASVDFTEARCGSRGIRVNAVRPTLASDRVADMPPHHLGERRFIPSKKASQQFPVRRCLW